MAERTLYMGSEDERELVTWVLSQGAALVPDLHYSDPRYSTCDSLIEFERFRSQTANFFVVHKSFSAKPLKLEENHSPSGGKWHFIMPRHGGPALDLLLGGEFLSAGTMLVRPGNVGYYHTYWDHLTVYTTKAPDEEVRFFKQLLATLKATYSVLKGRHRVYLVGPHAIQILSRGGRLVGMEEFSYGELSLVPPSKLTKGAWRKLE